MCGRYALALRPSQVRAYLENENMPVYDAPEDNGDDTPRQSYNFAPGYHGIIYRADTPDWGAGPRSHDKGEENVPGDEEVANASHDQQQSTRYLLQSMTWGLIPSWSKRNPDYGSMMKTINCRDDSLKENKGMWTSMKNKKRCIVIAQGFFEWLKKGKDKVPHFVKRHDGKLMCFAGLWDCVQYEGQQDKHYTYTIITTDSNEQLKFLHDRMPVILENGSDELRTWLDPKRWTWSKDLQNLLQPFEGELDVYPVSKDVGKVGNNSPNFIVSVASTENKSNIANFFAKGRPSKVSKPTIDDDAEPNSPTVKQENIFSSTKHGNMGDRKTIDHEGSENNAPLPVPIQKPVEGIKRELDEKFDDGWPNKMSKTSTSSTKTPLSKPAHKTRRATSNNTASPSKKSVESDGTRKITSFFK